MFLVHFTCFKQKIRQILLPVEHLSQARHSRRTQSPIDGGAVAWRHPRNRLATDGLGRAGRGWPCPDWRKEPAVQAAAPGSEPSPPAPTFCFLENNFKRQKLVI